MIDGYFIAHNKTSTLFPSVVIYGDSFRRKDSFSWKAPMRGLSRDCVNHRWFLMLVLLVGYFCCEYFAFTMAVMIFLATSSDAPTSDKVSKYFVIYFFPVSFILCSTLFFVLDSFSSAILACLCFSLATVRSVSSCAFLRSARLLPTVLFQLVLLPLCFRCARCSASMRSHSDVHCSSQLTAYRLAAASISALLLGFCSGFLFQPALFNRSSCSRFSLL